SVSNVVITPNNTDLVEFNSSVSLSCSSSGSSPFSYHWLNGSSEVTASDGVQLGDGNSTLTITNVTRYNQGLFMCVVSNPVSFDKETLILYISYGPENTRMKVTPPDVLYGSGSDLTLSCSSESSPPAQFQWALNGTLLSNKGPELRLDNIQASQSGSYSCWAHNTRTLRYQTPEPSDITVLEWMMVGQPLYSGDNIIFSENNRVLFINSANRTDSGEYLCGVSNPVSSKNASDTVNVICKYFPISLGINVPDKCINCTINRCTLKKCNNE
ncbi:unnamed protein product, partial [Coregonus sp. 'balchen']